MKDDIQPLYDASKKISNLTLALFWINIVASIISLFCVDQIAEPLAIVQIIVSVAYVVLSIIDDCVLWYKAEYARRKDCIQNAFNKNMQEFKTEGYYSNCVPQSFEKYGVNIFESNYYSKAIAGAMLPKEIIKAGVSFVVLLISFRYIASGNVLLLIAETLFSTFFIMDAVQLIVYYHKMSNLYNEAYTQFVSTGIDRRFHLAWLTAYVVEYECIKAYFKVRLNGSIFNKKHQDLQNKWNLIAAEIKITPEAE